MFWGYTHRCSRLIPGSAIRYYPWWCSGNPKILGIKAQSATHKQTAFQLYYLSICFLTKGKSYFIVIVKQGGRVIPSYVQGTKWREWNPDFLHAKYVLKSYILLDLCFPQIVAFHSLHHAKIVDFDYFVLFNILPKKFISTDTLTKTQLRIQFWGLISYSPLKQSSLNGVLLKCRTPSDDKRRLSMF